MAAPQEADADVHVRLRSGEYRAALEILLSRYRDRVFRLALSMLRDRRDAEDATQDVFLRLWRALPGYNARASLSTWIYAISRNACLSRIRQRRPEISLEDSDLHSGPAMEALAAPAADDAAVASVARMLDSLPRRYREVVTLFYMEDKSCEQTAASLGIPVGTVKALLHRARQRMIRMVGDQAADGQP